MKKDSLTLQEISETVAALETVFRDVVVVEKKGRSVIVAREHHAMLKRVHCFCGGESKPKIRYETKKALTYSTGEEV